MRIFQTNQRTSKKPILMKQEMNIETTMKHLKANDEEDTSESELDEEETESESDEEEPKQEHPQEKFKRSSYGRLLKLTANIKTLFRIKICI